MMFLFCWNCKSLFPRRYWFCVLFPAFLWFANVLSKTSFVNNKKIEALVQMYELLTQKFGCMCKHVFDIFPPRFPNPHLRIQFQVRVFVRIPNLRSDVQDSRLRGVQYWKNCLDPLLNWVQIILTPFSLFHLFIGWGRLRSRTAVGWPHTVPDLVPLFLAIQFVFSDNCMSVCRKNTRKQILNNPFYTCYPRHRIWKQHSTWKSLCLDPNSGFYTCPVVHIYIYIYILYLFCFWQEIRCSSQEQPVPASRV